MQVGVAHEIVESLNKVSPIGKDGDVGKGMKAPISVARILEDPQQARTFQMEILIMPIRGH